jgi:hypothetical protein
MHMHGFTLIYIYIYIYTSGLVAQGPSPTWCPLHAWASKVNDSLTKSLLQAPPETNLNPNRQTHIQNNISDTDNV